MPSGETSHGEQLDLGGGPVAASRQGMAQLMEQDRDQDDGHPQQQAGELARRSDEAYDRDGQEEDRTDRNGECS